MAAELLINVTPQETRVACIENGVLHEIYIERTNRRGLLGNIYKGHVLRVLPGMQAAFVDIGIERAAFLHASDFASPSRPAGDGAGGGDPEAGDRPHPEVAPISELVTDGQELLVQVVKDPIGSKGARLTTRISIPSCFMVYMPGGHSVGISQRIEDEEERARLRSSVAAALCREDSADPAPGGAPADRPVRLDGGYIVRTAAEGFPVDKLVEDAVFLQRLWSSVEKRTESAQAPSLVHEDLPLVIRTLRELIGTEIEKIRIDSRETHRRVLEFAARFLPELGLRIEHYPGERPIFDLYGVEDEVQKALERKVRLKSGGHLVFDQTEAMTTIDVNTGAYVGHRNLEETIFKTNLEATQAIARQVRLRNLGGIIIIDFIDMENEEHKRQVLRSLEKRLARDHAKAKISEVSALGLVEMTRKRTRESLEHILCDPCPTCEGRGSVKTAETVCYEIFREILREARQFDATELLVLASQEVVDKLVDEESARFAELEAFINRRIKLQVEPLYTQTQFDVVLL